MPHKNDRALAELQRMGGDVAAARQYFLAKGKGAVKDPLSFASNTALETVIENPDGKKRSSVSSEERRDKMRAVKIAITVAKDTRNLALTMPTQAEFAALPDEALLGIVLAALPAAPAQAGAFALTVTAGVEPIKAALIPLAAVFLEWKALVDRGRNVASNVVVQKVFKGTIIDMATIDATLKNTNTLIDEVKAAGTAMHALSAADRMVVATASGAVQGIALFSVAATTSKGHPEAVAHLDNIVAHPSTHLHLAPAKTRIKGTGKAIIDEIERYSRVTDHCTAIYLDAGTGDLLRYYAERGYSIVQEASVGVLHRRGSLSIDAAATQLARTNARSASQAKQVVLRSMVKALPHQ